MPRLRLCPAFVRSATCPEGTKKIDYFDTEQRGFMLEVRRSGGKTYYQRYTDKRGRERQYKSDRPKSFRCRPRDARRGQPRRSAGRCGPAGSPHRDAYHTDARGTGARPLSAAREKLQAKLVH